MKTITMSLDEYDKERLDLEDRAYRRALADAADYVLGKEPWRLMREDMALMRFHLRNALQVKSAFFADKDPEKKFFPKEFDPETEGNSCEKSA